MDVFMDDFSIFGESFEKCLGHIEKVLKRCEEANLAISWEKCYCMVYEGIVLGHKVSSAGMMVDQAKIAMIEKLPPPNLVSHEILLGVYRVLLYHCEAIDKIARERYTIFCLMRIAKGHLRP